MRNLVYCILVLFVACQPQSSRKATPSEYIPANARALLMIHDVERFRSEFRNNSLLESYRNSREDTEMLNVLEDILPLDLEDGSLVAFLPQDTTTLRRNWLLLIPQPPPLVPDSVAAAQPVTENLPWQLKDSTRLHVLNQNGILLVGPSSQSLESRSQSICAAA